MPDPDRKLENEFDKERRQFVLTVVAFFIVLVIVIIAGIALFQGGSELQKWAETLLTGVVGVVSGYAFGAKSGKGK